MSEMRSICAKCKIEMECVRNEVAVWHPYEPVNINGDDVIDFVVLGDKYKCPKCSASIITGFGKMLTAADYDYDQKFLRDVRDSTEEQIRILR